MTDKRINIKTHFMMRTAKELELSGQKTIINIGCGRAEYIPKLLAKYPELTYIGVESREDNVVSATSNLTGSNRWKIIPDFGYETHATEADVCVSLSVLEHVKDLETFIRKSVECTKKGGFIVHRYDLGHALYPSSVKERIQLWLCKYAPQLVNEYKYVAYVDPEYVVDLLEQNGARVLKTTYHQMPNHKTLLKHTPLVSSEVEDHLNKLLDWEFDMGDYLGNTPKRIREKLFPSICIWAEKR